MKKCWVPDICFNHKWHQKTREAGKQLKLICERCGKEKSLGNSEELFIKLPEQFEGEISDKSISSISSPLEQKINN